MLNIAILMLALGSAANAMILPTAPAAVGDAFHWEMCQAGGALQVQALQVTPDPVTLPGKIIVTGNFTNARKFNTPIKASIAMTKKAGPAWIPLPCIGNLGSCSWDDICKELPSGFPLSCPLPVGHHSVDNFAFDMQVPDNVPKDLLNGDFKMEVSLSANGDSLGCVRLFMNIKRAQ